MKNEILVLSVLLISNINFVFCDFQYPNVRRDDSVSDNYFGTIVKDPYRWLEDPDSNETKKFVSDENNVTMEYLEQNMFRDQISQNFQELYDYPKYGVPFKRGSKYFYSSNTGLQNQNVYYSIDSIDSNDPKVFLDPNQLSADGTTSLQFTSFSKDGKYCAYGISEGGSDWITIKIKNVETLDDLSDTLTKIKFSSPGWTHDDLGFFYAQYDEYNGTAGGTDPEIPQNQKLFYHRINTNQSEDIKIVAFPEHPYWLIGTPLVSDDGKYVHIFPQEGTSTSPWFFAKLELPIQNELSFSAVTEVADAEYYYVTSDDNLVYVRTNKNAAKFRLVRVDLNAPQESNWIDILPEDEVSVLNDAVAVNNDFLAVIYMRDVVHIIEMHNLADGRYLWDVDTPIGTVSSISAERNGTDLFYKITSFLSPGIIYMYDFNTKPNTIKTFKESKITGLDTTLFETNQVFFRSKDGTVKVPMFIVSRKNIKLDGSNPTMLYAYGGFNINIQPGYDPLGTFFINNLNGIYAIANIRGGGEYGESWHEAGMRTNKQNVFDDFASAAEYLINNNYTRRDRLTINGRSNGGLLVGASANQRPDLFGCALANVGVMDMIRFPLFTIGYAWREEYGYPQDNQTEFEYIYRYSPLHAIPQNAAQYPAMLILTADHDDRVVPAHSYKFAAELQYLLGSKLPDTPLMIRIDTNSGHGSGKPISKWIEEYTDIVSFVLNSLNIDYEIDKQKTINSINKQF